MSKKPLERRIAHLPVEIRKNSDGTVGVRGYAAVFDSPAHGEVIRKGAFKRTIEQRDDIRLLINHDGMPLARTKSGTLTIGEDDKGLWFDAPSLDVEGNSDARNLVSAMERGDIDQCSFAGYFSTRNVDGLTEVFEVKGVDVSVVTYPWYEETSVGLTGSRDADVALLCLRSLTPDQREEVLALLDESASTDETDELEPVAEEAPTEPAPEVEDEPAADEPRGMSLADARALLASFAA
jgi:HK97 family phage prohead protease